MFEDILGGFVTLFSDDYAIWFVVLAAFVGIVFGALPGLTAAAAIATRFALRDRSDKEVQARARAKEGGRHAMR